MMRTCLVILFLSTAATALPAPVIENPAEPPVRREVRYAEAWRAGADDQAEYLFGVIRDAVCDPEGNVYLLDTQQQCVFKFSAGGEYLGTVSRKGEGPGEIDLVYTIQMIGGDRIGMFKGFPSELIVVDTAGTPQPSIHPKAPAMAEDVSYGFFYHVVMRNGALLGSGRAAHNLGNAQSHTEYVVSLNLDGSIRHLFGTKKGGYDFTKAITVDETADAFPLMGYELGIGGEVYLTPERDSWLIEVRDQDGTLLRTITREWTPHERSDEEKEEAKMNYTFSSSTNLPPISYRIADTDPAIERLSFLGGELRVRSPAQGRDLPPGVAARYDVFDPEGHLLEERSCLLPYDRETDLLIHLQDGRIVRVKAYRDASRAANAAIQMQVGEEKVAGEDLDAEILEVIVYGPET